MRPGGIDVASPPISTNVGDRGARQGAIDSRARGTLSTIARPPWACRRRMSRRHPISSWAISSRPCARARSSACAVCRRFAEEAAQKHRFTISRKGGEEWVYEVKLLGLDVFDPVTMVEDRGTGVTFRHGCSIRIITACASMSQAFFPRTTAWDNLKRALKSTHEESVWEHLAGTISAPFEAGEQGQIAVKVIDDRGNELLVVKPLSEAIKKS